MIDIANSLTSSSVTSIVLPIGIDTELFRPTAKAEILYWRRELGIPIGAKVALSPRAFRENYGHEIILRSFSRAVADAGIEAYLVFKSYDCWDANFVTKIRSAAASAGIQNRIRIVESVPYERLPYFYALGDFAINFPVMDAFPVTFLEALACEIPVLTKHLPAYDSNGIRPYLQFTDAPTEESLRDGISLMLSCGDASKQKMSSARAYISQHFDESVVAHALGKAYRDVLAGQQGRLKQWRYQRALPFTRL